MNFLKKFIKLVELSRKQQEQQLKQSKMALPMASTGIDDSLLSMSMRRSMAGDPLRLMVAEDTDAGLLVKQIYRFKTLENLCPGKTVMDNVLKGAAPPVATGQFAGSLDFIYDSQQGDERVFFVGNSSQIMKVDKAFAKAATDGEAEALTLVSLNEDRQPVAFWKLHGEEAKNFTYLCPYMKLDMLMGRAGAPSGAEEDQKRRV